MSDMDNNYIKVTSEGREMLSLAMRIAIRHAPGGTATHYKAAGDRLIFYWHDPGPGEGALPFPFKMGVDDIAQFAWGWLSADETPKMPEPDHDGHNGHGFTVENGPWGQVERAGCYAFISVKHEWAMYGK